MSPEERQAALDNISPEDLAKIQAKTHIKIEVAEEDLIEAEFYMKFGFEAYWAVHKNKDRLDGISIEEMIRLLTASRKVDAYNLYANSVASFNGSLPASASKNQSSIFKKMTSKILQDSKADL